MRGMSEEVAPEVLTPAEVDALIMAGRFGRADAALTKLQGHLPVLEHCREPAALLLGLYGRAVLLRLSGAPAADVVAACDMLERAAQARRSAVWVAAACALRAQAHVDGTDVGAAMGDLARVDLEQLAQDLDTGPGFRLLDVLAATYARLRLHDRLDEVRAVLEHSVEGRTVVERAMHWASWSTELAGRGLEPIASGAGEPDLQLLDQAVDIAARLAELPDAAVPARLHRAACGVRGLAAAYRGRPSEAVRLLGRDAFADPQDLPTLERQVVTLAAMHAHALLGSIATARSLDEAAAQHLGTLPDLVLEVARARERLWLEAQAGGDTVPVLYRLTGLLVRLGWQGMDQVADTARQALEHEVLRQESRTDALTGVGNRRALDEELRSLLRFSPLPMAMILVDIDSFKWVNDVFTHVVGDEVLRRVATALQQQLRVGDKILRYGGDEFVVLLPRTGDQEARHVADRMGRAIEQLPWSELADGLRVGITTGCAALWSLSGRRPDGDAARLFRRADEALLEAKRGREGVAGTQPRSQSPLPAPARRVTGAQGPSPQPARRDRGVQPDPPFLGTGDQGPSPQPAPHRSPGLPQQAPAPQPGSAESPATGSGRPPRGRRSRHAAPGEPDLPTGATGGSARPVVSGPAPQVRQTPRLPPAPPPQPLRPVTPPRELPQPAPPPQPGLDHPDPGLSRPGAAPSVAGPEPMSRRRGQTEPPATRPPRPEPVDDWGPDPLNTTWRSTPLTADPLASQSASDRMLAPPPEPGRTGSWSHRRADPATGSMPLDPGFLDQAPHRTPSGPSASGPSSSGPSASGPSARFGVASRTELPDLSDAPATNGRYPRDPSDPPQRSRRRPAVIDLGGAEGSRRTPFG